MAAKSIITQPSNSFPPNQQGIKFFTDSDTAFVIISFAVFWTIGIFIYACIPKSRQHFSSFKPPLKPPLKTPCHRCRYFSNNHYLKCALHPETALTEQAVDCRDYCLNSREQKAEEF
ncbi:hypothetical protein [Chamaesiphon minutus]|uniref:Transmembrane protein n=1 Tax=Chamaesiphon minutus (strain ATCC 27169 / PCC 6605) TaxID=1173020 RepID=K9UQH4_CHAP6|nr:hypothetical protein [Chamaesiphon minutus]AFY96933.1 hypothetical protein Cha6605_6097 [Chamaesiphon minutus PCC 6605]